MAGWELHVNVADEFIKRGYAKNPREFMLGSLIPDCPWMDVKDALTYGYRDWMHHYGKRGGAFSSICNVSEWVISNEMMLRQHDLFKGMLTHIILDSELNTLWNTIAIVEEFDMIVLPDNKRVTHVKASQIRWAEVTEYNARRYGVNSPWFKYFNGEKVVEACGLLKDQYGLTNNDLSAMFENIESNLSNTYIDRKNVDLIVPASSYDRLIGIVLSKYIGIIDAMRLR